MENEKHHIIPYRTYLLILAALLVMTAISVAATQIDFGTLTVTVAVSLAAVKTALVLFFFMHLKFDEPIYTIMAGAVFMLIVVVILITFLDYYFR